MSTMPHLTAEPAVRHPGADDLRGRDMLCFSHDWSGDPLSKTHLMRLLARDNRILWVNSIGYRTPTVSRADAGRAVRKLKAMMTPVREVERNVFVLNPLVFPGWGLPGARALNATLLRLQIRHAMRTLKFRRPVNWVFNPTAAVVAGRLGEDKVIYYCVDEYAAFSGVNAAALADLEAGLVRRADVVFVSAERLRPARAALNPKTFLVRHGVDFDHFRTALDPATVVPGCVAGLPRPVIGYFGLMADDWVDLGLLKAVANHFSTGSVVLLGKSTMDLSAVERLPNVHVLGRQPYASLPAFSKGFDVGIIPFPVSEVTLNANPLKAREYLAAGLPVVSTAIPEVEAIPECRTARTSDEFVAQLEMALHDPGPRPGRSESMRGESWAARLEVIRARCASAFRRPNAPGVSE